MIFFKHTCFGEDKVEFEAIENESSIGSCTLILSGNAANVTKLEYNAHTPYVVEGLLKSAYNYAGLRNYYIAKCTAKNIDSYLLKMSFEKAGEEFVSDIPTILTGSCCK